MNYKVLTAFLVFFSLNLIVSFAQDNIININNTKIEVPETYDFGEISETVHTKYLIKNNRNSTVVVSDIDTPAGFFASISKMSIAPGKKVILYFGLVPSQTNLDGNFNNKITIKTNLITDIEVKIKGNIIVLVEDED